MTRGQQIAGALAILVAGLVAGQLLPVQSCVPTLTPSPVSSASPSAAAPGATSGATVDMRRLTGVLHVVPQRAGARAWIYVNGRIARAIPAGARAAPFDMMVVPDEYRVESVVSRAAGSEFPLVIHEAKKVTVTQGGRVSVELDLSSRDNPPSPARAIEALTADAYKRLRAAVVSDTERFPSDPVVIALNGTASAVAQSAPWRRYISVDLPPDLGGRRELDAFQVRALMAWVKVKWWGHYDEDFITTLRQNPSSIEGDELRRGLEELAQHVEAQRRQADKLAEFIAGALDKVPAEAPEPEPIAAAPAVVPTSTAEALDRTLKAVPLLAEPGNDGGTVKDLPVGTKVHVLREARAGWLQVEVNGDVGYVHMSRLGRCDRARGDLDCRWMNTGSATYTCVLDRCLSNAP